MHKLLMCLLGSIYLDHAGTTLYPKSTIDQFASEMMCSLLGNPHSASLASQLSTHRIEDTRLRALEFFNADPTEFDLVFVANATAGIKLVAEAMRAAADGFDFVYHEASHTSLIGVREEARNSVCVGNQQMQEWLEGHAPFRTINSRSSTLLFAYPGQSNMDGTRFPLEWPSRLSTLNKSCDGSFFTLLDAAALAATSPLDLSDPNTAPDFCVVSFSKMFGFPDLGALIVRRQAEPAFSRRRYFGGGTVETVVCQKEQWHAPKCNSLHERLEDGTLPIHSIIALDIAMRTHRRLFGSMRHVESHVSYLSRRLYLGLERLKHYNETPVCTIYSPINSHQATSDAACDPGSLDSGPIISFNVRNQAGAWISLAEVEKLASLKGFHIRTGGVCNPGGIASALNLQPWEIKRNFSVGFRCGNENDIIAGKPTGVIRVSLGAMSTIADVDAFISFISEFYCERSVPVTRNYADNPRQESAHDMYVSDITVYPIKSCGGFTIPRNVDWEVRPEGLAWDREWCLVHRGTGQALSQKRYTNMALIRPSLDFESGLLRVKYAGPISDGQKQEVCIPLSSNPALFVASSQSSSPHRAQSSRVCGEEILAQTYLSEEINDFFTAALGVSCVLARFPPGGEEGDKSARHAKAHLQKHQKTYYGNGMASSSILSSLAARLSGTPPSPPDSDAEEKERRKILLSNESPILAINMASLRALNRKIVNAGGIEVSPAVFRANITLDSHGHTTTDSKALAISQTTDESCSQGDGEGQGDDEDNDLAYAEDNWPRLRIGRQSFKMLGSCRRCHMVCINQETGEKSQEPFVTLSKTRRFEGKVFFGTHMCHEAGGDRPSGTTTLEAQNPTVRVGDVVEVVG